MPVRARAVALASALCLFLIVAASACSSPSLGVFGKQYEYEEDLTVSLDGSASLTVNTSLAALSALRGISFDVPPGRNVDRSAVRAAFTCPAADVTRVSRPWRRAGRQFVQVRVKVDDIRRLSACAPFSWSRYDLREENGLSVFRQQVGASAFKPGTLQKVGWNGSEIVAFRLHLPSRVRWHNSRDLVTNQPLDVARGNILGWEQLLTDRLDGKPLDLRVEMESESILYRTLWLFTGAFVAAVALLAALIWWTVRKGRQAPAPPPAP